MRKIKNLLFIPKLFFLYLFKIILDFTPNKKKNIIIGAMNGSYYGDNGKYIFEYILQNTNYRVYWSTNKRSVYKSMKKTEKPVIYQKSFKSIHALHNSIVVLYTNSLRDVVITKELLPKIIFLGNLRHGKSIKCVRYSSKSSLKDNEISWRELETNNISFATATSPIISY